MEEDASAAMLGNHPQGLNHSIWESYNRECKVFDKATVARWKVTMDGIVIFAALFSAVVTTFIIESYRTLSQDSNDVMILLLDQISQQLANNGPTLATARAAASIPFHDRHSLCCTQNCSHHECILVSQSRSQCRLRSPSLLYSNNGPLTISMRLRGGRHQKNALGYELTFLRVSKALMSEQSLKGHLCFCMARCSLSS
ncbi:hypothetical protein C8J56DRAFT_210130 [Mycena floridula]|nr:hypothetical protein C8J56DRAFT_210130 [Mycena floridula]